MGGDIDNSYQDAPVKKVISKEGDLYQEIVIAKRDDYLTATLKNKLPVCIDDNFESYLTQKTLLMLMKKL